MKKIWSVIVLICIAIHSGFCQQQARRHKKVADTANANIKVPPWAAAQHYDARSHAYFPDYYTFYDPQRGGYVFWKDGKYSFSPALPPFLEKVDMSKTRIKILKGLSLDLYPEQDYPYYIKMYPPAPNGNADVPVPLIDNPAQR